LINVLCCFSGEFKGHQILEAAKACDANKLKKLINADTINFRHTITLDSALVNNYHSFQNCDTAMRIILWYILSATTYQEATILDKILGTFSIFMCTFCIFFSFPSPCLPSPPQPMLFSWLNDCKGTSHLGWQHWFQGGGERIFFKRL